MGDESGSNPSPEKAPLSSSPSPDESSSAVRPYFVLIIEDNVGDVFLIREAIQASGISARAEVVKDGEKAIAYFHKADSDDATPCPDLVILDLNLPKKPGREVLKYLRASRRCADAKVIIATTSDQRKDREDLLKLGADSYFSKSSEYDEFLKLAGFIKELFPGKTSQ
jgi:DNA-binding response OmpR family regulator